jgi:Ca2+-binding EF-hand superfamily protein
MKLREIRTGLKRRYISRNNLRKIFSEWDRGGNGYIRPEDVQEVLQEFGIPVNSKESAALVATANTSKTGCLDLSEFIEFVSLNTDVLDQEHSSRIGATDSAGRLLGELQDNAAKVKRVGKPGQLKANIKKHLPILASDLIEAGDRVSLAAFTQAVMKLRIASTVCNEASLKQLYVEAGGSAEGLDTREFVRSIRQSDGTTQPRRTSPLAEEASSFDLSNAKSLHIKAKSASQITKSRLKQLLTEIEAKSFEDHQRSSHVFKLFDADRDGEG